MSEGDLAVALIPLGAAAMLWLAAKHTVRQSKLTQQRRREREATPAE